MSADIFLMGTAGRFDDPNRSTWREPIKKACTEIGISCFDPVVPEWNEEAGRREAEALRSAKVIVLAITADTVGMASLAESGWTVLSAVASGLILSFGARRSNYQQLLSGKKIFRIPVR
jgi:hypothetical protein